LVQKSFGPQNLDAALQALIVGQDVALQPGGDCTNEDVYRTALDSVIPAKVEQPRCFDEIFGIDLLIAKWVEQGLRFGEPCFFPDS
jgi:hypothetical protein